MLELVPPYDAQQLEEFAQNVDDQPKPGYPELSNRLFMNDVQIDAAFREDGTLVLPPGHDATNSPNRSEAPYAARAFMDPDIETGSSRLVPFPRAEHFRSQGYLLDQHGRPIHPGFRQLLQLTANDGRRLGMPTGIGQFYRYGRNGVADGITFRTGDNDHQEVLLIHRPDAGWATPGGYEESQDFENDWNEDAACAAARRELLEETGIAIRGIGAFAARMLPISSVHTVNAWSETHAVAFVHEDEEYLHDMTPHPGDRVDGANWFKVLDVLNGEVDMWSTDHVRYIEQAYHIRQSSRM